MIQINISLRMWIVFERETLMLLKTLYCKTSTNEPVPWEKGGSETSGKSRDNLGCCKG